MRDAKSKDRYLCESVLLHRSRFYSSVHLLTLYSGFVGLCVSCYLSDSLDEDSYVTLEHKTSHEGQFCEIEICAKAE